MVFLDKQSCITLFVFCMSQHTRFPLIIEPATPDDVDQIVAIERRAYPFPWSHSVLRNAVCSEEPFSFFYVGRLPDNSHVPGRIVGYHCFWLVADEVHILNIAVDPACQRRGYARQLLQFAFDFGKKQGACLAFLEVRASNTTAQQFYAKCGFERIGVRNAYYSDNQEDAYVLQKQLYDDCSF